MGKEALNLSGSTSGRSKGFSLLELIIVIAIIALMGVIAIPQFSKERTKAIDTLFVSLNALTRAAYNDAHITGALHRIVFDLAHDQASIERATDKKTASGDLIFEPVNSRYIKNSISWPEMLLMSNFYIKKTDELQGAKTTKVWFYINPDGVSQQIIINFLDQEHNKAWSFVLNPFTVQFKKYDEFQKPSQ